MIISAVENNAIFIGTDWVQCKMLVELLRRATASSCKEAAEAINKDGFKVSEADVQAMAHSTAFALGRQTDMFVSFRKVEELDMIAAVEAKKEKDKTVN